VITAAVELGRELESVAAQKPAQYADAALRFRGLDPTYVRSLFSGLREAVKAQRVFPWDHVVELAAWVLRQADPQASKRRSDDRDPGWSWTRKEIASLLTAGLQAGSAEIPAHLFDETWVVLERLSNDPEPTPEFEAQYGESNMDPATLSINTIRGEAMHGVILFTQWASRHWEEVAGGSSFRGLDDLPLVREVLTRHLDPGRDPSLAVRAVYGWRLVTLFNVDERWTRDHANDIFPIAIELKPFFDAAWEAFLAIARPHKRLYDLLQTQYETAVDRLGDADGDRRTSFSPDDPPQRVARHLAFLYWWNHLSLGNRGLLDRFYEHANEDTRAYVFEFMGRALHGSQGEVDATIIEQTRQLWEARLEVAQSAHGMHGFRKELSAFGWLFAAPQFDATWALEQLLTVLELAGRVDPDFLVLERLRVLSEDFPNLAVQALTLIAYRDDRPWMVVGHRDEITDILSNALTSGIPDAERIAIDLINGLAARREDRFQALLHTAE
jgi:hypothetical protein